MKNLAEFKRTIQVGQVWSAYNHPMNKNLGPRKVKTVQSNACSFETVRGESWLQYPKAKDFRPINDNTFQIYENETLILTYKREL